MKYHEPFLGGGSLFFALRPASADLSDANSDLIACYEYIRDNPDAINRYFRPLASRNTPEDYYSLRDEYNDLGWCYRKAALFLFLNRTCFNGIYRVNQSNQFNVPFGHKTNPVFPSLASLRSVSAALSQATLRARDFTHAVGTPRKNSFYYLDPPYPALNGTAYFTHYTPDRFSSDDQLDLADAVHKIDSSGAFFMMSNADTPAIRDAYSRFRLDTLNVPRWVSCKGTKLRVDELVIRNY